MTATKQDCPYCQPPFLKWSGGYWDEASWKIDTYLKANKRIYELESISYPPGCDALAIAPTEIIYCPLCGRKLSNGD